MTGPSLTRAERREKDRKVANSFSSFLASRQPGVIPAKRGAPPEQSDGSMDGRRIRRERHSPREREFIGQHRDDEMDAPQGSNSIKRGAEFVHALKNATLDESNLSEEALESLRNPGPSSVDIDEDANHQFATQLRHPDPDIRYYSFHDASCLVERLSGVVPIAHDMCINTCIGYTGPWSKLQRCVECGEPRFKNGEARRQFKTLPLGPIAQALYALPETAEKMEYRVQETERVLTYARMNGGKIETINDIFCGTDYLKAVQDGRIGPNDIVFQVSLDGAQLYRDKESDCWMFIYIFSAVHPDFRYTKKWVFPGGIIGGPKKPKHPDSFLFPALHHIAAVNKEGLSYYNAFKKTLITKSRLYCLFGCADGPAMCCMDGTVTCSGKYACRLHCKLSGRRRHGDYPALLLPYKYNVAGCDHPDAADWYQEGLERLVTARNQTQYEELRRETGICKPSIFLGLFDILGVPKMFAVDLMHLGSLNDPDLLLSLWRGTANIYEPDSRQNWDWLVLKGKVWEAHGETVALATKHIPSSFGRPPRNIAKKINLQYKAHEYLLYLYCLAPALLRSILPRALAKHVQVCTRNATISSSEED
ncbi:hypothetical protein BDZ89DRAFT_1091218 [Hymenopellis radicata]|nr:hypothetical protein BDZ89DRAFT_1091218 [Hymenopellis radicata]